MEKENEQVQVDAEKDFVDALTAGQVPQSEEAEETEAPEPESTDEETPEEPEKEEEVEESSNDEEGEEADDTRVELPKIPSKHPDLKEGDYVRGEDGRYVVKAEHLAEDIDTILQKDASVYLKIAKAKPDKAAAIANILGISADETRSASEVLGDVVRTLKKSDPATGKEILQKHMPYLFDRNREVPFSMDQGLRPLEEGEKPGEVKVEQPQRADGKDVDLAIYKLAAESKGKLDVKTIENDEELAKAVSKYKYDLATGRPLTPYERLSLAAKEVFSEEESDDAEPIGGARGARVSSKPGNSPLESEFEKALKSSL